MYALLTFVVLIIIGPAVAIATLILCMGIILYYAIRPQETPRERRQREAHEAKMHREELNATLLATRAKNVDLDIEIKRARLIGADLRNSLTEYKVEEEHKKHSPALDFKAQNYPDPSDPSA